MNLLSSVKNHTIEIFVGIQSFLALKFPATALMGATEWAFGVQNIGNLKMLVALIVIDFCTSIGAQFKGGGRIESRRALKTVTKTVVYGAMIAGGHLAGEVIGVSFIDTATISFLAITELISILENVGRMGYAIPNKLLDKLVRTKDE